MTDAAGPGSPVSTAVKRMQATWSEVRRTSYVGDWLVTAVTLAVLAVVGAAFYGVYGVLLSTLSGASVGFAAVLARSNHPFVHAAASSVSVVAAVAFAALTASTLGVVSSTPAVAAVGLLGVSGLVLAATGATVSVSRRDDVAFADVARTSYLTASGFLLAWAASAVPRSDARDRMLEFMGDVAAAAAAVTLSPEPGHAVFGLFALTAAATLATAFAVSKTPFDRLSASVDGVSSRASKASNLLYAGFLVSASAAAVSGIASTSALRSVGESGAPPMHLESLSTNAAGAAVAAVASSAALRWLLATAFAMSATVAAAAVVYSWMRDGFLERFVYRKTAVAVGFVTGLTLGSLAVASGAAAALEDAVQAGEGFAGVAADVGGFALVNLSLASALVLLLVVCLVLEAVRLAVASSGWTAPAFAATGLFLLAVAAVLVDLYVGGLAAAAAALYVWDVGRYAAVLKRSQPSGGSTSSVELVHAAGGFLLAVVAVTAAVVSYFVAPLLAPADPVVAVAGLVVSVSVVYYLMARVESAV